MPMFENMSEELDYHITFPSPIPDDAALEDEEEELYNQGVLQREPVIILLGWLGCQDKHLAKYSEIYEHRKCITIRYTLSADKVFYKSNLVRPTAIKVLEMIEDLSLEESPIIFHVMSNAGCILYRHISNEIQSNPRFSTLKVRGSVFDSCPSRRKLSTGVKAYHQTLKSHPVVKYLLSLLFALYLGGKAVIRSILGLFGVCSATQDDFFTSLLRDPADWPQLYLYSMADDIVSYKDIDEIITERRKNGHLVFSLCWEDSDHVAHLRQHREPYIKQCYDFLDICLAATEAEDM